MKLQRLEKDELGRYEILDAFEKINEIIDFLNGSFLTNDADTVDISSLHSLGDITCDTLIPKSNEHTLNRVNSDQIFDDMCLKTEPNPWSDKKCPHCGKSYYTPGASYTTAVYCPPIYKDGVNINPDRNTSKTTYHCYACGKDWTEET